MRKLKANHPSAGLYNTRHLPECLVQMGYIPYAKTYGGAVECVVLKTYLLCVTLRIPDIFQDAPVNAFISAVFQHLHIYIVNNNTAFFADPFCHEHGNISSSAAYIYGRVSWLEIGFFCYKPLPEPVCAEAHEVVHKVVFVSNRGKYILHPLFFFLSRDYLIAEVCCVFIIHYFLSFFITGEPIRSPKMPAITNPAQLSAGAPHKIVPPLFAIAINDEPIINAAIISPIAIRWPRAATSSDKTSSL